MSKSFWKSKKLHDMNSQEWESLCDGCGRCCLNKLEDWDTGEIYWTNIACSELDCDKCQCSSYDHRFEVIPDCIDLTPDKVEELTWLPPTCAYRLVSEGKDLHEWHHLISGSQETVHQYGISVRGRVFPEADMKPEEYENHIVRWPGEIANPKRIKKKI